MNYEKLSTLISCRPMNFLLFFKSGDFDGVGYFGVGYLDLGDFGIGDFDFQDLAVDFDM